MAPVVITVLLSLVIFSLVHADTPSAPLYSQNFENLPEGKAPSEFMVLGGGEFRIKKIDGNTLLELAPYPIETYGVMFGPEQLAKGTVSARIQAEATGKRFPEFGLGILGTGGYKLWLMPAIGELQILRGGQVLAKTPYKWTSAQWTRMKFSFAIEGDKIHLKGKAWPDTTPEPEKWMVESDASNPPNPSRVSLWSTPYSGKPTRFDDLVVGGGQ